MPSIDPDQGPWEGFAPFWEHRVSRPKISTRRNFGTGVVWCTLMVGGDGQGNASRRHGFFPQVNRNGNLRCGGAQRAPLRHHGLRTRLRRKVGMHEYRNRRQGHRFCARAGAGGRLNPGDPCPRRPPHGVVPHSEGGRRPHRDRRAHQGRSSDLQEALQSGRQLCHRRLTVRSPV